MTNHPSRWVYEPIHGVPARESEIGGKAYQLAELEDILRRDLPTAKVPTWIAITVDAFDAFAEDGATSLPEELRDAVLAALERAHLAGHWLAVRSSALGEDSAGASFAGQFDTVLGVRAGGEELWNAIRRVWASARNPHATAYAARAESGSPTLRMAVILQELLDPDISGVAFAADPVSGRRDVAVVSAVYGLGEGLVSGELNADTFRVSYRRGEVLGIERTIVLKERTVRRAENGGTQIVDVPEARRAIAALTDQEARSIANAARVVSQARHRAQDLEWALVREPDGAHRLRILQTRAITTLPAHAASLDTERRIWDNSNIIESYCGVTTPLTFSFARSVYEDVYRQFCRLMGVSGRVIDEHQTVFANLLGLVRGRVYYNLLNWYRVLGLLPGFEFNRGFMERMMGVREALADPPPPPSSGSRMLDLARLVRAVLGVVFQGLALGGAVPAFHARVQAALGPVAEQDLTRWSVDELAGLYRRLERDLLRHWRAPLVNDFFAMVFFGALGRLTERRLPKAPPTLVNDLLCGEGGIISTEPARAVMALAREVYQETVLRDAFAMLGAGGDSAPATALWERIHHDTEFRGFAVRLDTYVARFGDRCMEELKLETVTLAEDPSFLLQMIRAYAERGTIDPDAALTHERDIRHRAETIVRGELTGVRRWTYLFVLGQARARVRDRENLRFERTRVFGVVRRIFLGLGARLVDSGRIDRPRDVFFLTREEIFGWVEGTAPSVELRAVVALRRAEFAAYEQGPTPPDRFETFGPPGESFDTLTATTAATAAAPAPTGSLQGTGCCPGVVRERVVIVRDPRVAPDVAGKILVAERTDPGWTLLFPAARGLLVQRGSLLSHSAIVAREMGLPCIVGIANLMTTLRDGEEVEMDGATGVVRRLEQGGS
jgi:rifampicin phosphotransferase